MTQNIISITLLPNELEVKKLKDRKVDREIFPAICALLNHHAGGKLVLTSKDGTEFQSQISVSSFVRSLEQRVKEMFGLRAMSRFSLYSKTSLPLVFNVSSKALFRWFSLTSNLYLPSNHQVLRVSPVADPEGIHGILTKSIRSLPPPINPENRTLESMLSLEGIHHVGSPDETNKPIGSLPQPNPENWIFVEGQSLPSLKECKQEEFNLLISEKEGNTSFVDRIFNNKFASYVSAFANDCGGRIFYGINDDGVVEGEIIFYSKTIVTEKVGEVTSRMIWSEKCGLPEKGKHWDIYFEEVVDGDGRVVPSTFVIIITVAACPGGVFTKEPESYVLVEGKVQRMGFEDWKERFIASRVSVLASCALTGYSAFNLSDKTLLIAQRLAKLRQTGEMGAFRMLAQYYLNEAEELRRLVQSEQAAYEAAENGHVEEAKDLNDESTKLSYEGQVHDSMVLEVKQPKSSPQIPSQQFPVFPDKTFPKIRRAGFHNLNTDSMQCNALHEGL